MVVVSTPSRRLTRSRSARLSPIFRGSGSDRPGRGSRKQAARARTIGTQKALVMIRPPLVARRPTVSLTYAGKSGTRDARTVPRAVAPTSDSPGSARDLAAITNLSAMARQRAIFPRDTGLQARMLFTLFLLGLLYVALIGALIAAGTGLIPIVVIIAGLSFAQLFFSDKLALAAMGAKEVSPEEAPGLHAMIERLCIQADLPKPRIAVADTSVPNAFATGRSQKSATVCATTGIMRVLSPSELEGVMAHELAHIKHRDVLIMTIASFFASIAAVILQFGFFFGGDVDENPSILIVLLVSFVVYILSFFLMLALSRYREFAADRGAAIVTGRPSALASALVKVSGAMQRVPTQDLRQAERLNAFFIVPTSVKGAVQTLFSTHPPMEQRIARLQQLEAQLQRPVAA